jgi:hypothetical protein
MYEYQLNVVQEGIVSLQSRRALKNDVDRISPPSGFQQNSVPSTKFQFTTYPARIESLHPVSDPFNIYSK